MNGLTDAILSALLSWIRVLIANLWSMVSSENGSTWYQFFAAHWLKIVLALCVGGYVVDRIIYFIRWRPHYVWLSRLNRTRNSSQETEHPQQEWVQEPMAHPSAWQANDVSYAPAKPQQESFVPAEPTQVYAPVQEPVLFDDNDHTWDETWPAPEPQPQRSNAAAYYRDVQSGFAPPIPPEQLYAPPVHPGLNENAFRQNFGLEKPEERPVSVVHAPAFRPFTASPEYEQPQADRPLARLAKRARNLVGADPDHELSIRDLQPTVDVAKAFHEPVYPMPLNQTNDSREVHR